MTTNALIPLLISLMLLTGVCNTLLTKYQDNICIRDCENPDPKKRHHFEQPVVQTIQMFIGEMGSWLFVGAFYLYRRFISTTSSAAAAAAQGYTAVSAQDERGPDSDALSVHSTTPITAGLRAADPKETRLPLAGWKVTLLGLPAVADICGTTLMNVGLLFVVPSIYQMTRGALVLFVGLFSVVFLRRQLHLFQWFALFTVVAGVAIVGLAGAMHQDPQAARAAMLMLREVGARLNTAAKTPETLRALLGVFLIAGAQIFTASQFVLEEYILEQYALEPLKVVGWEGLFGFSVTLIAMVIGHLAVGRTDAGQHGYFDLVEAWREVTQYREIAVSSILIMISIGGFNFFGLSVTRTVSATARSTIDTCRTLFIWMVSLFLGWESFKWLQVLGFALLVYGTFLFNGLVRPPLARCVVRDYEALSAEEPVVHPTPLHASHND